MCICKDEGDENGEECNINNDIENKIDVNNKGEKGKD